MLTRQTSLPPFGLPRIWLVSDARNDPVLEAGLHRLPRGSGLIFRHDHLSEGERRARFDGLRRLCRRLGHALILSGSPQEAQRWGADGSYGPPCPGRTLITVHALKEIARANRLGAAGVLLSPVYPTRSHPGAKGLGRARFLLLAQRSRSPVIALGGMTQRRFRGLKVHGWAAIDGLSPSRARPATAGLGAATACWMTA